MCKRATPLSVNRSAGLGHSNRCLSGAGVRTYNKLWRARWITVASWWVQNCTVISAARSTGLSVTFLIFAWNLSGQVPFPQDSFKPTKRMTVFHITQRDSEYPRADALASFQESITKLHHLLLEQATSGETESRWGFLLLY